MRDVLKESLDYSVYMTSHSGEHDYDVSDSPEEKILEKLNTVVSDFQKRLVCAYACCICMYMRVCAYVHVYVHVVCACTCMCDVLYAGSRSVTTPTGVDVTCRLKSHVAWTL